MLSILSRLQSGSTASVGGGVGVDIDGQVVRYLTDGVDLYRFLGEIAGGMGRMVGLENCRSLDVMLVPVGELRAGRLRAVVPASDDDGGLRV